MSDRGRGRGDHGASRGGSLHRGSLGTNRGRARGRGVSGSGRGGQAAPPQTYHPSHNNLPIPDATVESLESRLVPSVGNSSTNLGRLSINQDTPLRPAYGTRGTPVALYANLFQILPDPEVLIHRHQLDISPELEQRPRRAHLIKLALRETPLSALAPAIASDFSSTILTTTTLNPDQSQVEVVYRDEGDDAPPQKPRRYRIRLQPTGTCSVANLLEYLTSSNISSALADKQELLQTLNIVANTTPRSRDPRRAHSSKSNAHFRVDQPSDSYDLGAGLQAWRGFLTSIRLGTARLLVNVQIKHVAMYKSVRLDELMTNFRQANGPALGKLAKFIARVRVDRLHLKRSPGKGPGRPKAIFGLASPFDGRRSAHPPRVPTSGATAKQVQFYLDENAPKPFQKNTYVSVFDFFATVYGIKTSGQLPVVNVGTAEKPSYLPPEVCLVVPAQPAHSLLSPDQTASMIKYAVRPPYANAHTIAETGLGEVGLTSSNQTLQAFGFAVIPRMITVKGRILIPPNVRYAKNRATETRFGSWNLGNVEFAKGARLDSWSVLWLQSARAQDPWNSKPADLVQTLNAFHSALKACGVIANPAHVPGGTVQVDQDDNDDIAIHDGFRRIIDRGRKEKLLLVILPRRDDRLYAIVKKYSDIHFGIHTVCVVASKFAKPNNIQYFANVALKVNLKLGGTNHLLEPSRVGFISQGKTMVVGIDVTHPSPGSDSTAPSVAAMVASTDKNLGQFPAALKLQEGRKEMVEDLSDMLKSRLALWRKHNSQLLPENIIVYRDGVSESQYSIVLDKELPLLRKACAETYPASAKPPAFAIIICGKRHNVRFYPTSASPDLIDTRSSNTKHGTVVDRGVTEARCWDFYLQAHTALQGTARPCHYFVVLDEIFRRVPIPAGFTSPQDVLEDITHNLCYMFGRATKAVSYAPPAYYADMACERARCYLRDLFSPTGSQVGSISGESEALGQGSTITLHKRIEDTMFYI